MPAPDSTVEEVRSSVLRYLRMYEEGQLTLGDLAAELAVMTAAYAEAMGSITDHYGELLAAASRFSKASRRDASAPGDEFEQVMTGFRRGEAEWKV
jgi:hypothetical protein